MKKLELGRQQSDGGEKTESYSIEFARMTASILALEGKVNKNPKIQKNLISSKGFGCFVKELDPPESLPIDTSPHARRTALLNGV